MDGKKTFYNKHNVTVTPAIITKTIVIYLIKLFNEGPKVSLNGLLTVWPKTPVGCAS